MMQSNFYAKIDENVIKCDIFSKINPIAGETSLFKYFVNALLAQKLKLL